MRVLVCGGRDFNDKVTLETVLNDLWYGFSHEGQNEFTLIHGDAPGADRHARNWCRRTCYEWCELPFPANWRQYGKRAGYIRNQQMLDEGKPDLVIAFPGGKGTKMMVKLAKDAGVEVKLID